MAFACFGGNSLHRRRTAACLFVVGATLAAGCGSSAPGAAGPGGVAGPTAGARGSTASGGSAAALTDRPGVAGQVASATLEAPVTPVADAEMRRRMRDLARDMRLLTDELVRPEGPRQELVIA